MNFLATPGRRRVLFTALYMSEGAPIGFLWWALPTILRSSGASLESITALTSLLVLPWALKFLWAPAIDILRHRLPLTKWILLSQFLMGVTVLPLLILDFTEERLLVTTFLILHSIAAATQDVSIDALCIRVTDGRERGSLNGWMQSGMLTSRAVLGGGALLMMKSLGLSGVIFLLVGVVWFSSVFVFMTQDDDALSQGSRANGSFKGLLLEIVRMRSTWFALLFAAISGAAFEAVGAVAGPLLIDHGFSSEHVGWFFLLPAIIATIGGSLIGGSVSDRTQRTSAVRWFLVTMALCVICLAGFAAVAPPWLLITLMTVLYFCIGLFVASTYALFMDLCHPSLGATQFSTYMGATNACESWSSFAIGRMAGGWGYSAGFLVMAGVSLSALPLLKYLGRASGSLQPTQQ